MAKSVQRSLGPMGLTNVDPAARARSTSVDQAATELERARQLLCKAASDLGYTLDSLEAAMGKGRAYIGKVLNGEKPMSLAFITALPDDLEARFELLRAESLGLICVEPVDEETARRQLVSGLFGVLSPRRPMAKVGLEPTKKTEIA
jgi:hypothetical protein